MHNEETQFVDIDQFLRDAVTEILRHEDASRYLEWARKAFPDYIDPDYPVAQLNIKEWDQLATLMARMVWNSTPLPGNDFRPRPLPAQRRNDRCDCGSGKKYKQCCALAPAMEGLQEEALWHVVVDVMPEQLLNKALERKRIPRSVITTVAEAFLEKDRPEKAVTILESLFTGKLSRLDPEMAEYAFDLLMDAYDRHLQIARKVAFIERILANAPRGPLRSVALQRKTTMLADQGKMAEAWEAFAQAMRDDPDSVSLCVLELQLLLVESRWQQARDRAVFWQARISRLADKLENPQRVMDFLQSVLENPQEVARTMRTAPDLDWDDDDEDWEEDPELMDRVRALQAWVANQQGQPVPQYRVFPLEHFGKDREDGHKTLLLRYLASVGLPDHLVQEIVTEAMLSLQEEARDPESMLSQIGLENCRVIQAEESGLVEVESLWDDVFPMTKPLGTVESDVDSQAFAWEEEDFAAWMPFLEEHPEAFGSLSILEDLLNALIQLPEEGIALRSISKTAMTLINRSSDILRQIELEPEEKLPWMLPQNRSMLRGLLRSVEMLLFTRDDEEAERVAKLYLQLNPTDEQNVVSLLCSVLLRLGKDDQVMQLAVEYPDNDRPELSYSQAIVLYRQGRLDEAESAMLEAMEVYPMVPEYMFEPRIGEPDQDDYEGDEEDGFTFFDANAAWDYVLINRELWEAVPGLMEWAEELFDRMEE